MKVSRGISEGKSNPVAETHNHASGTVSAHCFSWESISRARYKIRLISCSDAGLCGFPKTILAIPLRSAAFADIDMSWLAMFCGTLEARSVRPDAFSSLSPVNEKEEFTYGSKLIYVGIIDK